jgi:hypothetical protein
MLRVKNLTERQQKRLHAFQFQSGEGMLIEDDDIELAVGVRKQVKPPMIGRIDPGDSVSGWLTFPFKHRPHGGTPAYELTVRDEIGK